MMFDDHLNHYVDRTKNRVVEKLYYWSLLYLFDYNGCASSTMMETSHTMYLTLVYDDLLDLIYEQNFKVIEI